MIRFALLIALLAPTLLTAETIPHPCSAGPVPLHYFELTANNQDKVLWFRIPKNCSRTLVVLLQEAFGARMSLDPHGVAWTTYDEKEFDDYFSFIFVRNPWDRLLSCYLNTVVGPRARYTSFDECSEMSFEEFVVWLEGKDWAKLDHHVHPQVRSIPPGVEPDFIGRVENFDEDVNRLLKRFGMEASHCPRINASKHGHYREYYNERTKEIVARLYKEDIERFGYEF